MAIVHVGLSNFKRILEELEIFMLHVRLVGGAVQYTSLIVGIINELDNWLML